MSRHHGPPTRTPAGRGQTAAQNLLTRAVREHQSGRLEEAKQLYLQVLANDVRNAKSLYGLGLIAHQSGNYESAAKMFQRAIAIHPNEASYHAGLGAVLQTQRKFDEAVAAYRQVLALKPNDEETYFLLGNILLNQGISNQDRQKLGDAKAYYERALSLRPEVADTHNNLGIVSLHLGQLNEAKAHYEQALALNPKFAEAHNNLGNILRDRKELDEAAAHYERALALKPEYAEAHNNLGIVLQRLERLEEAAAAHERAVTLRPEFAEAHNNLGVVLRDLGRLEESGTAHERALELIPEFAEALNNLGVVRRDQGRLEESRTLLERALALKPDYAEALCNLGNVFKNQRRLNDARMSYEQASRVRPDLNEAQWNQCLIDLMEGNYAAGWRGYEVRHRRARNSPRSFPAPLWHGEPLNGARILLHSEQGLGDSLQFLRYVPMVQAAGGTVLLDVPPALRRIAAELPDLASLTTGEPIEPFAWQCPLMSLPFAFGTRVDSIPARVPYLTVPEEAAKAVATRTWPREGLRVGVVWSGNPKYSEDWFRSIPTDLMRSLLEMRGVHFFSLQLGAAATQLSDLSQNLIDLQSAITDMADTAALVHHLDLIISVDTSVAHLAGALGKQTWVLLPFAPDWRWLLDREDSPWYPTIRLFRQPEVRDWRSVMERVRTELAALATRAISG